MPAADPSMRANPFAERLSEALADSALSLTGIRTRLLAEGIPVSTATLSYWSSGRSLPSRGNSLAVVQELERILDLPAGALLETLPQAATGSSTAFLGKEEAIRAAVAEHGFLTSVGWRILTLHRVVTVGADGAHKSTATRQVMKATTSGLVGWTNVYDCQASPVEVESLSGVHVRRDVPIEGGLRFVEFAFDQPVERGECVMASTVLRHTFDGDVVSAEGIGLPRPVDVLVQEVCFEGQVPTQAFRRFRANDADDFSVTGVPARLTGNMAQMTVAQAAAGLHELYWEW